jgi:hypothetical protein
MKPEKHIPRIVALALLAVLFLVLARGSVAGAERIGTYDSRVVAFAAFWDESNQARLQARIHEAREAKERGDISLHQSLAKELSSHQDELHMQVFSTAPIDQVLAGLQNRLPALMREAGVSRLVSQWDEAALAGVATADRVDVTDLLVREFHVPATRQKHLEQLRNVKPLPLERARLMSERGQL